MTGVPVMPRAVSDVATTDRCQRVRLRSEVVLPLDRARRRVQPVGVVVLGHREDRRLTHQRLCVDLAVQLRVEEFAEVPARDIGGRQQRLIGIPTGRGVVRGHLQRVARALVVVTTEAIGMATALATTSARHEQSGATKRRLSSNGTSPTELNSSNRHRSQSTSIFQCTKRSDWPSASLQVKIGTTLSRCCWDQRPSRSSLASLIV